MSTRDTDKETAVGADALAETVGQAPEDLAEMVLADPALEDTAVSESDPATEATVDSGVDATVAADSGVPDSGVPDSGAGALSPLRKGEQLGRYLVVDTLGAGGMGVVYRGFDPDLHRQVALKLLRPRSATGSGSGGARTRLMREAQAMAKLAHPNILTVYDVGTLGDQVYIAMELVDGATLEQWMRSRARSVDEILDAFEQAAAGLSAAHEAELIHRDFKPDNVLVDGDGRVRVMDFGLAAHLYEGTATSDVEAENEAHLSRRSALDSRLTQTGALLGTPAYMSPEQFEGKKVDARSDQFSFAVALFEALYGARPFAGRSVVELREAVVGGTLAPVSSRDRPVPVWLASILRRALSNDPAKRFDDLAELVAAIHLGRRRRRRIAWGLGGLILLLAAVAVVIYTQRKSASTTKQLRSTEANHRVIRTTLVQERHEQERLAQYMNSLAAKREQLLHKLVSESDAVERAKLACRIAGLEDVIKARGNRGSAKIIIKAISRCMPVIKRCYDRTLKLHPRAAGTVKIDLVTDRNGSVKKISFPMDTVGVKSLRDCIFDAFNHWKLPTGGGDIDPLHVVYPFHFKPSQGGSGRRSGSRRSRPMSSPP